MKQENDFDTEDEMTFPTFNDPQLRYYWENMGMIGSTDYEEVELGEDFIVNAETNTSSFY